jgi:DNA anti-recombination protein RmuC
MDEKQFKLLIDKLNEMKYILTQIQGSIGYATEQRADVVRELGQKIEEGEFDE